MRAWDKLTARQRKFVQTALAGMKNKEPPDILLTQEDANEAIDAALDVLSKAITFSVT